MSRFLTHAVLALLVIGGAACGDDDDSAGIDAVEGIEWHLTSLRGSETADDADPTLLLEAGTASGLAGCNRFTGAYTADGNSLSFGPLGSTMMSCGPPLDQLETAYLAALGEVGGFEVSETELRLTSADGDTVLVFGTG